MQQTPAHQPLISVIVPVYNTSRWLRKCMDSICRQTYSKLQILAIDDGSTDSSLDILREYAAKDPRIEVIHQENAGLSAARNAGLRHAKGDWITGVDSDDYLLTHTYETLVAKLNPEADIVCYGAQPVDENDKKVSLHIMDILFSGTHAATPELSQLVSPTFQNKLWRSEFFHKWELQFANGHIHEDEILWRQACAVAQNIQLIPDKLYCYLQRTGSIMHSKKSAIRKTQDYCKAIRAIAAFYDKHTHQISDVWRAHLAHSLGAFYDACVQLCSTSAERAHVTQEFSALAAKTDFGPHAENIYPLPELKHPGSRLRRLFIKREFNKTTYCLFCLPLWTIRTRKNKTSYRLFGIPIWKTKAF